MALRILYTMDDHGDTVRVTPFPIAYERYG
jgi:hypothetical protein